MSGRSPWSGFGDPTWGLLRWYGAWKRRHHFLDTPSRRKKMMMRKKGVELGWGANGLRQGRGAGMEEGMVRERDLSGILTGWHS